MTHNEISRHVVDAALRVHTALGPGFLESAYEASLSYELKKRGLRVDRQVAVPIVYESVHLEEGYRLDLLVEGLVVVEIKSIERVAPVHHKQVLTYLRLANKRLALLINFNVALLKEGIWRIVNGLEE
jgi:GxxExxY protein